MRHGSTRIRVCLRDAGHCRLQGGERQEVGLLNEAERLADQAKQDEKALKRTNERLARLGKPAVKSLDELPADFEAPDEYLVEAANITADLAKLSKRS